jgi:hypothetical protein
MPAREGIAGHAPAHSRELLHALKENACDLILIVAADGQIRSSTSITRPVPEPW